MLKGHQTPLGLELSNSGINALFSCYSYLNYGRLCLKIMWDFLIFSKKLFILFVKPAKLISAMLP